MRYAQLATLDGGDPLPLALGRKVERPINPNKLPPMLVEVAPGIWRNNRTGMLGTAFLENEWAITPECNAKRNAARKLVGAYAEVAASYLSKSPVDGMFERRVQLKPAQILTRQELLDCYQHAVCPEGFGILRHSDEEFLVSRSAADKPRRGKTLYEWLRTTHWGKTWGFF